MARKLCSRIFVLMCLLLMSSLAFSAEIKGRSSTQLLWFNDDVDHDTQLDMAQYLRVGVTNIDKAGKFSIYGYGRGTQDLNQGGGNNGRLYYLYGEYADDKYDARLGRQFVSVSAGSAIIDGGQVNVTKAGPIGFTLLGGREVFFSENGETGQSGDYAVGAAAFLTGRKTTDLEISWMRKTDRWDIARDTLGAMFRQYLFGKFKLYGDTRYDIVSETFSDVQAGVRYFPTERLEFLAEWYQSYPSFDATSIYSVFAVNRFQEAAFRSTYAVTDRIVLNGGYRQQSFGDGATADVYEAGIKLRPVDPVVVNVSYDKRQGYGGDLDGIISDVTWNVTDKLEAAGGVAYDVYRREDVTDDEIARRYWVGSRYRMAKNLAASVRVENNVNARYHDDYQGRVTIDYDF